MCAPCAIAGRAPQSKEPRPMPAVSRVRAHEGPAFLSYGFRPFFLLAAHETWANWRLPNDTATLACGRVWACIGC